MYVCYDLYILYWNNTFRWICILLADWKNVLWLEMVFSAKFKDSSVIS